MITGVSYHVHYKVKLNDQVSNEEKAAPLIFCVNRHHNVRETAYRSVYITNIDPVSKTYFPLDMTMNKLAKLSPIELKYWKKGF